jgi:hypothetical protein
VSRPKLEARIAIATALRRARAVPLSRWMALRGGYAGSPRGAMIPADVELGVTADFVAYEEREPRITPTGVLDHRGMMLVRVTVPIKEHIGFGRDLDIAREPDEVETIIPEDLLAVSDCGLGVGFVTPDEVEDEPAGAEQVHALVQAALEKFDGDAEAARAFLADLGIEVEFTVTPREPSP